jgi:hypothetical protein
MGFSPIGLGIMSCNHNDFTEGALLPDLFDKFYAKAIREVIIDKNKGEFRAMANDIIGFCEARSNNALHLSLPQNITEEKTNVFFVIDNENRRLAEQGVHFGGGRGTINYMISITHSLFRSIILPNSFIFSKSLIRHNFRLENFGSLKMVN